MPGIIWLLCLWIAINFSIIYKAVPPEWFQAFYFMRIDRVKYTAHYDEFGVLKDQWIGLEAEIDDTEIPEKQLDAIKAITDQWYRTKNSHLQLQGPVGVTPYDGNSFPGPRIIEKSSEDRKVGLTPELIMSCEDIVTLQSFYMLVDKSNRVDLKEAYDKRKDELRIKETKEILDATNALTKEGSCQGKTTKKQ